MRRDAEGETSRRTSGRTLLSLTSTSPERSQYRNLVKREKRGEYSSSLVKRDEEGENYRSLVWRDEEGENYRSLVRRERGEGGDYRSLVRRERGEGGDYRSLVKRGERGEKYRSLVRREQGEGGNYRSLVRREASEKPSKVLPIQPEGGGGGGGGDEGKTEGSSTVKKDSAGSTGAVKKNSAPGTGAAQQGDLGMAQQGDSAATQQGDSAAGVKSKEETEEKDQSVSAPSPPSSPHTTTVDKDKTQDTHTIDKDMHGSSKEPVEGPSGLSPDAMMRGFYVFIGIGTIVLVYIAIKFVRLRRRRAPQKYGLLSHTEDQEMFPLAADDGDDEEIYNASDHQHILK
ncbi:hypothetical protein Pcinc_037837 [Petrolisthes cinctipes]|uniref:Uncharacterized protein n=1 Tax=Petrolisthes cinctipes TaxID=88211 RepID=A0AAE1BT89_PETCI|nr:hypothetical protein Pcinc_037837 [Petrolisthes cinctipes]